MALALVIVITTLYDVIIAEYENGAVLRAPQEPGFQMPPGLESRLHRAPGGKKNLPGLCECGGEHKRTSASRDGHGCVLVTYL